MNEDNVFYSIEFLKKLKADLPETISDEKLREVIEQSVETDFFQLSLEKKAEIKNLCYGAIKGKIESRESLDNIFSQEVLTQISEILDS
jgi:hypothetical protein